MKIYRDGQFTDKENLDELFEPGYLFGWGVFETLRSYNKKIPFLDKHLSRLKQGLDFLELEYPKLDYLGIINNLLEENRLSDAYLRINGFKKRKGTGLIIQAAPFDYYQSGEHEKGVKVIFSDYHRFSADKFLTIKSLSYVKNRLAWLKAQKKSCEEALFFNEKEILQEGSRSNIFFVKDKKVFTPALFCGLLEGITRSVVVGICRENKIEITEGEFTGQDLLNSDEVFLTSSLMEIMPVSNIDDKKFDIGSYGVMPKISKLYREIIANSV